MSAYIVDPVHIDVLLSVAINGPEGAGPGRWPRLYVPGLPEEAEESEPLTAENADLAGRRLLLECIESVSYRYGEPLGSLPGPVPNPDPQDYEWTDFGSLLSAVEALCAIDGYEYQSCEHPGWCESGSSHFCHGLRLALIRCLRGYEEAEWHWSVEKALARAPHVTRLWELG